MIGYSNIASKSYASQEDLITDHIVLAKRIAFHLSARLPSSIDIDDLLQAGMIGLLEAANNFDASRGASFDTYAGIRIRGAILDEVRKLDWTPRSVHRKHREVSEAIRSIEAETGRRAKGPEIADRLGISVDEYHAVLQDSAGCRLFSLEVTLDETTPASEVPSSNTDAPDQELFQSQFRQELVDAIQKLPARERMVLSLYYERELNLREIGKVLGVSESRICQLHGQALVRLRATVAQ